MKNLTRNDFLVILGLILGLGIITIFYLNSSQNKIENKTGNAQLQITTSFYPLYFFTTEITKDNAKVSNLTPAGVEPHDYEPTPRDITNLHNSNIIFVNGGGFEPWLEKMRNDLTNTKIVDTSTGIKLLPGSQGNEEDSKLDPHIWLSPVMAKSQADQIYKNLVSTDPEKTSSYESNYNNLQKKLEDLDSKYRNSLLNCSQKNFVTSHSAFSYLANEYGLIQISISGLSPDEEPSLQKMAEMTKFIRENNIKYIFFEKLVSPKLSEALARETGAKTLVLDPIEGLSDDEITKGENYFTVMEKNLSNLQLALECV